MSLDVGTLSKPVPKAMPELREGGLSRVPSIVHTELQCPLHFEMDPEFVNVQEEVEREARRSEQL